MPDGAAASLLQVVAQSTPMVLWAMDSTGVISRSTGQGLALFDLAEGEAVGWNVFETFARTPEHVAIFQRALAGESFRWDHQVPDAFLSTWFRPRTDASGRVAEVVCITMDVTEVERAHRRSEANERQKFSQLMQLVAVQDSERHELAQDLHDDTLQILASLGLRIQMLERRAGGAAGSEMTTELGELHLALQGAVDRFRAMIFTLEPPVGTGGLGSALRDLTSGVLHGSGVSFDVVDRCPEAVDEHAARVLYRVAQEALSNVVRHSGAQAVVLTLASEGAGWSLTVCDDGKGPGEAGFVERRGHRGLAGMRERVVGAGGTFMLHSGSGGGSELRVWVPLKSGALLHDEAAIDLREPLREILDEADEAFVAVDRDWRYVFVNRRAAEVAGRPARELEGKNIWAEFPGSVGSNFYVQCMRAMAEQRSVDFADYYNGRWLENRLVPTSHGLFAFYRDVTAQRRSGQSADHSGDAGALLLAATSAAAEHSDPARRLQAMLSAVVDSRWFTAARVVDGLGVVLAEETAGEPALDGAPGRPDLVAEPLVGRTAGFVELEGRAPSNFAVRWLGAVLAALATPEVERLAYDSSPASEPAGDVGLPSS